MTTANKLRVVACIVAVLACLVPFSHGQGTAATGLLPKKKPNLTKRAARYYHREHNKLVKPTPAPIEEVAPSITPIVDEAAHEDHLQKADLSTEHPYDDTVHEYDWFTSNKSSKHDTWSSRSTKGHKMGSAHHHSYSSGHHNHHNGTHHSSKDSSKGSSYHHHHHHYGHNNTTMHPKNSSSHKKSAGKGFSGKYWMSARSKGHDHDSYKTTKGPSSSYSSSKGGHMMSGKGGYSSYKSSNCNHQGKQGKQKSKGGKGKGGKGGKSMSKGGQMDSHKQKSKGKGKGGKGMHKSGQMDDDSGLCKDQDSQQGKGSKGMGMAGSQVIHQVKALVSLLARAQVMFQVSLQVKAQVNLQVNCPALHPVHPQVKHPAMHPVPLQVLCPVRDRALHLVPHPVQAQV
ncbi:expressed unknown protein [Seminavis robusta]|uniref:Uncharacterized protein n=1 Tax=Seminavis robusta TaxID=568900 RepID=A0A9N8EK70_9STRA|nr:expressed unknown protein [Seminavis robusta]|eukprot:Sro1342_g264560.1 n/a (399) ;mRNA; f:13520-14789